MWLKAASRQEKRPDHVLVLSSTAAGVALDMAQENNWNFPKYFRSSTVNINSSFDDFNFFFKIFQKLCWHIFQKLRTYMCILDFIYHYASLWSIKLGIQLWLPYYIINPLSNMLILPSGSISGKRWAYILPGWVSTHRCLSLHPSLESSCSFMVVPLLMITYQGNSQSEGSWQCLNLSQGWVPHIYWKVIFPPIFI